jgi:two-component system chemotaxis response regulator CheY
MNPFDEIPRDIEILVVDDVPSARKVVSRFLSSLGFSHISESGSGGDALKMIENSEFHLVVTDLHLKDMLGVELLEKSRGMENNKDLPFLVITSDLSKDSFEEVVKQPFISYLFKPFNRNQLRRKMLDVLAPEFDDA